MSTETVTREAREQVREVARLERAAQAATARLTAETTVLLRVPPTAMELLVQEALMGPWSLTVAVGRFIAWGERRTAGTYWARLPLDDVEDVLAALYRAADRLLADPSGDSKSVGRRLHERVRVMVERVERQGWAVALSATECRLTRVGGE